jgi:hypothetical protein
MERLHQCIHGGRQMSQCEVIVGEEDIVWEFMEQSDNRSSVHDIWPLAAGEISLFNYNSTFVTWFFGLGLVWHESTPRGGRRLQII